MPVVHSLRVVAADRQTEKARILPGRHDPANDGPPAMNTTNFAARLGVAPRILLAFGGIASLAFTGCQVDVGGQTLPSAYYLQDDIQYFPAGPEFKLSKEAAAQKAYKKEIGAGGCGGNCGGSCGSCGH